VIFSEQNEVISKELVSISSKLHNVIKTADNPFYNSRFTELTALIDYLRPILSEHDCTLVQETVGDNDTIIIHTMLLHETGQYIQTSTVMNPIKHNRDGSIRVDIQTHGSANTYGRRYAIKALFNIAEADNDGNENIEPPKKFNFDDAEKLLRGSVDQATFKKTMKAIANYEWLDDEKNALRIICEEIAEGF